MWGLLWYFPIYEIVGPSLDQIGKLLNISPIPMVHGIYIHIYIFTVYLEFMGFVDKSIVRGLYSYRCIYLSIYLPTYLSIYICICIYSPHKLVVTHRYIRDLTSSPTSRLWRCARARASNSSEMGNMMVLIRGYSSNSHFIWYFKGTPQLNSRLGFLNPGLTWIDLFFGVLDLKSVWDFEP